MAIDYTYAVARIRAIEAAMPDKAWFLRMARSPARQLLTGVREYYPGFEGVDRIYDFETGIEADFASLFDLFSSILGEGPETEFLRAGADFDNYVMAVKGNMMDGEPVLLPFGLARTGEVAAVAAGGDPVMLPDYLKKLHDLLASARENGQPAALDREGERAKWAFLLGASPTGDARLWVRLKIDAVNIKSFARLRSTGLWKGDVSDVWIAGGTIEASRFASLYPEPFEDFLSFLESTEWRGLKARGFARDMEAWRIDAALDGEMMELTAGSRSRFFDIMPLLHHLGLREMNARLLRTVFTGRINGLPEDDIVDSVEALLS